MSNAPVCHISTGSTPIAQPRATLLPSIGVPVDLPSAIQVINQLKLLVQTLAGQQAVNGANGNINLPLTGGGNIAAGGGASGPGAQGQKGKDGKDAKHGRFVEDRSRRVQAKKRIYQNNDKTSENYVDIMQINKVVWVDSVTGETITWSR